MGFDLRFRRSMRLFEEASKVLPAGANSSPRLWRGICPSELPCALFVEKAVGSHIWDVDGNEYVDYRLGFGPVILGHSHPAVYRAVHRADQRGLVYALNNELEIVVARKVCAMVRSMEKVRFTNSGTEAVMAALRVARAFTGKEKVVKFEGHYHGSSDYVLFSTSYLEFSDRRNVAKPSSLGIPERLKELVVVAEWNNFENVERVLRRHHREVAALICEPVAGNMAVIPPVRDFLKHLRELCDRYDVVLIFDEVKTGFRLSRGGAQEIFRVTPDVSTVAKSMGNGYPIAAFGGRSEIMDLIGPGKVYHGGTYTSNPVSLQASAVTLDILRRGGVYEHIRSYGHALMRGLARLFEELKVSALVQGHPGMFQFLFTDREVRNFRDLRFCDMDAFADLQVELLKRGVMIDEDNEEPMYTCWAHSREDLRETLEAFQDALEVVKDKVRRGAR